MQICSQNINPYKATLLFQELFVMPDAQSYHWPQKPPQLQRNRFMATEMAPNSPGSFSLWGGSYKSWHNNWIKIWPNATCMEVTGVFPVSRGLTSCQSDREGQGSRRRVSGLFCINPQLCLSSAVPFCWILSFNVFWFPQVARRALLHLPSSLLSVVRAPSFIALLLVPPSCWHALSVPPGEHTRIDLTISAIQPPKSNYHGHNSVIKSNGLLEEAPTLKQKKSFSPPLHIILCVTLPVTMNRTHTSAQASFNYRFFLLYRTLNCYIQ